MRARRLGIHVGGSDCPAFEADLHILLHLRNAVNFDHEQILDKDAFIRTFLEVHARLVILGKQVMNLLIIDFDEAAADEMGFRCVVLGNGDDLLEGAGDDASSLFRLVAAHHRVRLAAARLPVREDGPVVPVQHAVHQRKRALLVDQVLRAVGCEHAVEGETFGRLLALFLHKVDLVIFYVGLHHAHAASRGLLPVHRPASHHHLHALSHQ